VRLSDNLRDANVYVLVEGGEEEILAALAALRHAAPYIRKQVGFALQLRHTPEIHFIRDMVEEKGARVDRLLEGIERELENKVGEFPEEERMSNE
jgi:ribosome-binding factor A